MPAPSVAGSSHIWLNTGYVVTTATVARHTRRAVANRHRPRVIRQPVVMRTSNDDERVTGIPDSPRRAAERSNPMEQPATDVERTMRTWVAEAEERIAHEPAVRAVGESVRDEISLEPAQIPLVRVEQRALLLRDLGDRIAW